MLLETATDEELMHLYRNGNEQAFKALYNRHSAKVYGYLKAKVKNQEKAHDIFQEVFVKIHKSKHLYNSSFPFLPWLFTVTKNTMTDEFRKNVKLKNQVPLEDIFASPEPIAEPDINQVLPYLSSLPTNQRHALELRYIEEKTFEDISKTLNTSQVNVRKIISRGVQKLKELLNDGDKS